MSQSISFVSVHLSFGSHNDSYYELNPSICWCPLSSNIIKLLFKEKYSTSLYGCFKNPETKSLRSRFEIEHPKLSFDLLGSTYKSAFEAALSQTSSLLFRHGDILAVISGEEPLDWKSIRNETNARFIKLLKKLRHIDISEPKLDSLSHQSWNRKEFLSVMEWIETNLPEVYNRIAS